MLQMFSLDVAKVDMSVAHVTVGPIFSSPCCSCRARLRMCGCGEDMSGILCGCRSRQSGMRHGTGMGHEAAWDKAGASLPPQIILILLSTPVGCLPSKF
jgi:hypothetical protein